MGCWNNRLSEFGGPFQKHKQKSVKQLNNPDQQILQTIATKDFHLKREPLDHPWLQPPNLLTFLEVYNITVSAIFGVLIRNLSMEYNP